MIRIEDAYDYMIYLISSYMNEEKPVVAPVGYSFEDVYALSVKNDMAAMTFYSLEGSGLDVPADLFSRWRDSMNSGIKRDLEQQISHDEIADFFDKSGIRYTEIQGSVLKLMYPKRETRSMSDIDFIIDLQDLVRAGEGLRAMGYETRRETDDEIDLTKGKNISIEIHTRCFPESMREYANVIKDPFEGSVPREGTMYHKASDEILYTYSFLHLAKHYRGNGCGVRRFLDAYILDMRYPFMYDNETVKGYLEKAGEYENTKAVIEFSKKLFSKDETELSDSEREMSIRMKKSGLHGNTLTRVEGALEKEKEKGKGNIKFRYVLKRMFLPLSSMKTIFPVLKKLPFLLPFCWIIRLVSAVFKKGKKVKNEIKIIKKTEI